MKKSVSIIMSVYNTDKRFLTQAIDSILSQTFKDFEFIIIDDNSNQATKDLLLDYSRKDKRIVIIANEFNIGLTKSLNIGLSVASGNYIARMDSDDIALPNRLQIEFDFLEKNKDVKICATSFKILKNNKTRKCINRVFNPEDVKASLFFGNGIIMHSSVMFSKELITESKTLYDENYKKTQDFELWTRIIKKYNLAILREYLMIYRVSDNQISNVSSEEQINYKRKILVRNFNEFCSEEIIGDPDTFLSLCKGEKTKKYYEVQRLVKLLCSLNKEKHIYDCCYFKKHLYKRYCRFLKNNAVGNKKKILFLVFLLRYFVFVIVHIGRYI